MKDRMISLNLNPNKFKCPRGKRKPHPNKLKAIDDDNYRKLVNDNTNSSELARKCGYGGVSNISIRVRSILIDRITTLNIDTSHWKELPHTDWRIKKDVFVKDAKVGNNQTLKRRLTEELKWSYECRKCKNKVFETRDGVLMWMDEPIELTLEHKNGDNKDNRLENLEFLYTYCHQQTRTFCRSKKARLARAWVEG